MSDATDLDPGATQNPGPELRATYWDAINRMQAAFKGHDIDKNGLMDEAKSFLREVTPKVVKERYGLGSGYSPCKEFACETLGCNAAVVVRILEQEGRAEEAKAFLIDLYQQGMAAGFDRKREFLLNRLDSRTFMPMRRHIDEAYLRAIGYEHLDQILLCVGDCQTTILAEIARDSLPLAGVDIASYQHRLASLAASPLAEIFGLSGYFFFVNSAANLGIHHRDWEGRDKEFARMRGIVAWLREHPPEKAVFVTHVFFGVENAVLHHGTDRELALHAIGDFSDEIAAILAQAPNATLINFQEICPFTHDRSIFRDPHDEKNLLHFRLEILNAVAQRICEEFSTL